MDDQPTRRAAPRAARREIPLADLKLVCVSHVTRTRSGSLAPTPKMSHVDMCEQTVTETHAPNERKTVVALDKNPSHSDTVPHRHTRSDSDTYGALRRAPSLCHGVTKARYAAPHAARYAARYVLEPVGCTSLASRFQCSAFCCVFTDVLTVKFIKS